MAKRSRNALSKLASRIVDGAKATQREVVQLAELVLSRNKSASKAKKSKAKKSKAKKVVKKRKGAKKRK